MAKFTDFTFNMGSHGKMEEFTDSSAIVLAIRNLLLTRPGNYPSWPDMGINLEKYTFDFLDAITIAELKSEISTNIEKYLPPISNIIVDVRSLECNDKMLNSGMCMKGQNILGIHISGSFMSEEFGMDVLYNKETDLLIVDEV